MSQLLPNLPVLDQGGPQAGRGLGGPAGHPRGAPPGGPPAQGGAATQGSGGKGECLRREHSDSGMGYAIPPAVDPGEAEQTCPSGAKVVRPVGRSTLSPEGQARSTVCGSMADGMAQEEGPPRNVYGPSTGQ